jgi:hypothetical protein
MEITIRFLDKLVLLGSRVSVLYKTLDISISKNYYYSVFSDEDAKHQKMKSFF